MTEIVVKRDAAEVAREAAGLFVSFADEAIATRGRFFTALAGGSTPKALYRLLSGPEFKNKVDWSKIVFFFGDERNVPPDAEESNFRMARESLFDPLGRDDLNVFRWATESGTPSEVASRYESTILQEVGEQPIFDLILLGLGLDAHTASLFPFSPALREATRFAIENWVEKFNAFRLTMTLKVFNAARNAVFVVAGGDKKDALRIVLEGDRDPQAFPAQAVSPKDGRLIWLLDEAAAADLLG
jgi:6-phosphogluconolactonase